MLQGARRDTTKDWKSVYIIYIFCNTDTHTEMAIISIKQAFLKSNESSLNKKSDAVEIDVASNHINDNHEVHEVSITPEVQEGETLLGRVDLDLVKTRVSYVTKKRGWGPYIKYTNQGRAQIENYCSMHGAAATLSKSVSTFPNLNERMARTMRQKCENELKEVGKEQRQPKQLIANKNTERLSSLVILMEWFRIILE